MSALDPDTPLTDLLAAVGITHRPDAGNGRRYLYAGDRCIGVAHYGEAQALVEFVQAVREPLLAFIRDAVPELEDEASQRETSGIGEYAEPIRTLADRGAALLSGDAA